MLNTTFEKGLKAGYYRDNLRLDVSAVQHDMKREETVEEVEKNTEWQRRTPKPEAPGSSPGRRTKNAVISTVHVHRYTM